MRITVVFEDVRLPLDVRPDDKVKTIRNIVNKRLMVDTFDDKRVGKYLEMRFGGKITYSVNKLDQLKKARRDLGAALQDQWILQDLSIASGSVIKSSLKTVEKPKLQVYLAYNEETLSIMDDVKPTMLVADLRSYLSKRLGLPVSVFQLFGVTTSNHDRELVRQPTSTKNGTSNKKIELYDNNTLDYYGIELGSTLRLDLWDGWRELIVSAISGHEKTALRYFSWDKVVRSFQYRAVLYIAAHFGHMGLSVDMIKRGAKAHEPIGTHPTRKWCNNSEHKESLKCPVHVACVRGHLPILRLFVKSSPLCFVALDEEGLTPLQITLRLKHRDCFEYLIVRQWGRKVASDVSLPIIIYCRLLQWTERAKAKTLLKHGTGKSSYRGIPPKVGALVGTGVLVDGYSKKPTNTLSFNDVPKPVLLADKAFPAIALARRKYKSLQYRQSSIRSVIKVPSTASSANGRRPSVSSSKPGASVSSSTSRKNSTVFEGDALASYSHERELLKSGNRRTAMRNIPKSSTALHQSGLSGTDAILFESNKNKTSKTQGLQGESLPRLTKSQNTMPLPHRGSRISFKATDSLAADDYFSITNTADEKHEDLVFTPRSSYRSFNSAVKRRKSVLRKPKPRQSAIPLPAKSLECQLKPFFYWPPQETVKNPVDETLKNFQSYRGAEPRQHAVQCLAITSEFTEKRWLQQLRMAVSLSKRGVKKKVLTSDLNNRSVVLSS